MATFWRQLGCARSNVISSCRPAAAATASKPLLGMHDSQLGISVKVQVMTRLGCRKVIDSKLSRSLSRHGVHMHVTRAADCNCRWLAYLLSQAEAGLQKKPTGLPVPWVPLPLQSVTCKKENHEILVTLL